MRYVNPLEGISLQISRFWHHAWSGVIGDFESGLEADQSRIDSWWEGARSLPSDWEIIEAVTKSICANNMCIYIHLFIYIYIVGFIWRLYVGWLGVHVIWWFNFLWIHSGNLTYQWKIHHLKMYFLFKMGIFHLPEGTLIVSRKDYHLGIGTRQNQAEQQKKRNHWLNPRTPAAWGNFEATRNPILHSPLPLQAIPDPSLRLALEDWSGTLAVISCKRGPLSVIRRGP